MSDRLVIHTLRVTHVCVSEVCVHADSVTEPTNEEDLSRMMKLVSVLRCVVTVCYRSFDSCQRQYAKSPRYR